MWKFGLGITLEGVLVTIFISHSFLLISFINFIIGSAEALPMLCVRYARRERERERERDTEREREREIQRERER